MNKPALLGLAITACLAAACGPAQAPAPPAGEEEKPRLGGTAQFRIPVDPFDWDITYRGTTVPNDISMAMGYNSLLGVKTGPDVGFADLALEPELAERWEVSSDAKRFTFHLRKGAKYANMAPVNGREVTSKDVKWSVDYFTRAGEFKEKKLPAAQFGYFFDGMTSVETPDPYTVVFNFSTPNAPFINYAASDMVPVLPREIYDQDGHFKDLMVGSGPYQVDLNASQKGTRWVWKKNPTYWDTGKPYIDEVRWNVIQDKSAAFAAFQSRQIDFIGEIQNVITPQEAQQLKSSIPNAVVMEYLAPAPAQLYVNARRAPLNDVRVRKAISRALDRDEFTKVLGGGGWALSGALTGLFSQEEIKQIVKYDPEEARRLLAEAGHPNGLSLEFSFNSARISPVPELLESQLKKAGIQLAMKPTDNVADSANRRNGNFFLTWTPTATAVGDPANWMYAAFHPESTQNYWGANDPKLTAMLEAQQAETDPAKRRDTLRQAARYINAEGFWGTAIVTPDNRYLWQPYLRIPPPNFWRSGELAPVQMAWLAR